jgi:hypothetical protein
MQYRCPQLICTLFEGGVLLTCVFITRRLYEQISVVTFMLAPKTLLSRPVDDQMGVVLACAVTISEPR